MKYGTLFADQSKSASERTERTEKKLNNQSQRNKTFEKNRDVKENYERTKSASTKRRQKVKTESSIRNSNLNCIPISERLKKLPLFKNEMNWGATAEVNEIIRRQRKSPKTLRLVERRLEISGPGTMRRKIGGELLTRANRFGGGYQPLEEKVGEQQEPQQLQQLETIEDTEQESEGESQVIRGDNFPIVDLKSYNSDGKEIQFIQINQVIEKVTVEKKSTEDTIKRSEFNFMLDLKTLIAKSSTDAELNRVRDAMRRCENKRPTTNTETCLKS